MKLNSYMNPFQKWLARWRLRRIILALSIQSGANERVHNFARQLEATEIMSRGMKKNAEAVLTVERADLESFIRYMTSLHDSKLSRILLARVGLAALVMRDEKALQGKPEAVIEEEAKRAKKPKQIVIATAGEQSELKL